jgi:hypothetical protein
MRCWQVLGLENASVLHPGVVGILRGGRQGGGFSGRAEAGN